MTATLHGGFIVGHGRIRAGRGWGQGAMHAAKEECPMTNSLPSKLLDCLIPAADPPDNLLNLSIKHAPPAHFLDQMTFTTRDFCGGPLLGMMRAGRDIDFCCYKTLIVKEEMQKAYTE